MTEPYQPETPRRIVLWGATGAGKSSYLSTLVFFHRQPDDERRLCVLPANAVTAEWVARQVRALCGDGRDLRAQTIEARELRFHLHDLPARAATRFDEAARRPSRWLGELAVWDVPGATYDATPPTALLDAMLDASGIILLIDPGLRAHDGVDAASFYTNFFQNTLGALVLRLKARTGGARDPRLDDQNRLRIPVAICLTKADEHEMLRADESRRLQLREIVGESAGLLETFLTTHTVIAISALGRPLERSGASDRVALVGEPRPWNALRPLRWMLERPPLARASEGPPPTIHNAPTIEVTAAMRPNGDAPMNEELQHEVSA